MLNETIGSVAYDELINSANPETDVFHVTLRKLGTAGTIKRGTVLALSTGSAGDGKFVILGTSAASNEVLTANCILADDYDVGTAADVTAVAYRLGHFNRNKLIVKAGYTFTAADEEDLRKEGIILDDAKA